MSAAAAVVKLMIRTLPSPCARSGGPLTASVGRPTLPTWAPPRSAGGRSASERARRKFYLRADIVLLGLLFIAICTTILYGDLDGPACNYRMEPNFSQSAYAMSGAEIIDVRVLCLSACKINQFTPDWCLHCFFFSRQGAGPCDPVLVVLDSPSTTLKRCIFQPAED